MPERSVDTPLGRLTLTEEDGAIVRLRWGEGGHEDTALLRRAERELREYFAGERRAFTVPVRPAGNDFQIAVWQAMQRIPFGETREYGEIARETGAMPQPVGTACGQNPIPVIIPCHRVVGATGLGGFSAPGGVETKVALLRHEGGYSLLI